MNASYVFQINGKVSLGGKSKIASESSCIDFCQLTTVGKMRALLQKNFLRMWRNVGVMLFIFALPVMQVILFCLAIGRDPTGLHLAIVNDELNSTYETCPEANGCHFKLLSCKYLQTLRKDNMVKDFYETTEDAINAVKEGNAWGVLYFTENFTDALVARMTLGSHADAETLDQSEIRVWLDMSNQQIGLMISRDLQLTYRTFAQSLLTACHENPELADIPITFKEPVYGNSDPSFTDFVAPGVILTIVFFLAVALTSSALIIERMEGLLDRSWVAGVIWPIEGMPCVLQYFSLGLPLTMATTALRCILSRGWTIVERDVYNGFISTIVWILVFLSISMLVLKFKKGFVISAICELERNAIQLALGSFYPTLLLSGVIWPIEGMPCVLQYFSLGLPLTMATTALRCILSRGWTIVERDVYNGFISTIVWILVFLSISMLVLKFKKG
ncbi:hypothetical protein C0J52_26299 [Blattella germanica]|nr:hypothetical protein C0J52_26299 [Blattella germanica]